MNALTAEAASFTATVRKEWQVMRRYPSNLVMVCVISVVIPASYLAQASGFSGGGEESSVAAFAERSGTTEVAGFIYLGWAVYLWISMMLWGPGSSLRQERMQGSLEMVYLTPVSRFTLLFAPAVVELIPAMMLFTVVGLMLTVVFGIPIGLGGLLAGLLVIAVSIPALFSLGALMAVLTLRFRDAEGLTEALRGALGILCGVTFPIAVLPGWIQPVSESLPPTEILELLRGAVLQPSWPDGMGTRLLVLLFIGAALGTAAVLALGRSLKSARHTGRLGQF